MTLHHEIELGLLIGKPLRNLPLQPARNLIRDAIGGYCLAIDLTARNVQSEAKRKGLPWTVAKGFDGFCPVSELIPRDRLPDLREEGVGFWLKVNGAERQRGNTRDMLFGVDRLLGEVSRVMTLEVGDLVLTGTPAGVGELRDGDLVEAGVEVAGQSVQEGRIEVSVRDAVAGEGVYEFSET